MSIQTGPEIRDLAQSADRFQTVLETARRKAGPRGWTWYTYDSLGLFEVLDGMLTGPRRHLMDLIGSRPVLDIGCGDGALSFFFELLGFRVTAVDYSETNANRMQGVRALRGALDSKIDILDVDMDHSSLPEFDEEFGIALALGILYHGRNPFHVLDEVARHARYCLVSTRVAQMTPDGTVNIERLPVAYLVDSDELNTGTTNYWVFSQAGLDRLFRRTGWHVVDRLNVGCLEDSDPVRAETDERCYCLLRRADVADEAAPEVYSLAYGWHGQGTGEKNGRWTARKFGLRVRAGVGRVRLELYIPPELTGRVGGVTLTASFAGVVLNKQSYHNSGRDLLDLSLPEIGDALIDFELDKCLPPSAEDPRELGIVVVAIS